MPTLREEWIEKIKKVEQRNIYSKGGGYFTVMTDFYLAPDEIRYDKEMCFKVLLEANECFWNIPKEIRTNEFLIELMDRGYKGNVLLARKSWAEEDFPFVYEYLSKFEKDKKPKFNSWITFNPSGIFANRDMIFSLVKDHYYKETDFLLKHYKKDKEILCALLDNYPDELMHMPKSIKNAYFKDKENIYKLLEKNKGLYQYLPEKLKILQEVIEYELSHKESILYLLPEEVLKDRDRVFDLIKKYPYLKGSDIPYEYRKDFEIAKHLIGQDGKNFSDFDFKGNDELIRLATKTYNSIAFIPNKKEYGKLIREVTLKSSLEENKRNYAFHSGNMPKAQFIKDLLLPLLKENKLTPIILSEFFNIKYKTNEGDISNMKLEKALLLESIQYCPEVYNKLYEDDKLKDFEITHCYIEASKVQGTDYKSVMPWQIKNGATQLNMDIDKYVMSKYLEQKLPAISKAKVNKI